VGHATTASALVASWYGIERSRTSAAWGWPALAGAGAAAAIVVEYTSALVVPALALYAILTVRDLPRATVAALLAAVPPLAILAAFHALAFGSVFQTPYSYMANPVYVAWHSRGLMGIGRPDAQVLAISFLDPARGLFVYAPFLALGLPGLAVLWRRDRTLTLLCAVVAVTYALFTAGFTLAAWGWSIGPRHLTPLCAFLVPPALAMSDELRRRRLGFVPAGLAVYSIAAFALICAVCPYFPVELTNPLAQLVLPFARAGLHVTDVVGLATGGHSAWMLLPWVLAVATLALATLQVLAPGRGRTSPPAMIAGVALAMGLALLVGRLGGPDRFERTRRAMMAAYTGVRRDAWAATHAQLLDPGSGASRAWRARSVR
jgi:hypothetical protein